jgi:hypothetical protein
MIEQPTIGELQNLGYRLESVGILGVQTTPPLKAERVIPGYVGYGRTLLEGELTVDFDNYDGCYWYERLLHLKCDLLAHRKTPKGYHLDLVGDFSASKLKYVEGIELITPGRFVFLLGTKHGVAYEWLRSPEPVHVNQLDPVFRQFVGI